jgi:ArsR family transcriptional regulator
MDDFVYVMKALSDANRVRMIKLLQNKDLCVCELQQLFSIPQPTVSKHMKVLEKAGMVKGSKEGLWVNYALDYGSSNPYAATILGNLRHWLCDDSALRKMEKKLPDVKRHTACKKA